MRIPLLLAALILSQFAATTLAEPLDTAHEHFLRGRYDEARELYADLLKNEQTRADAAIGLSLVHELTGEWQQAEDLLQKSINATPANPRLWGRLAEIQFLRGRNDDARNSAERGLKQDTDELRSRWILASIARQQGRLEEALDGYRWFVRYYNRVQPSDAEQLRYVALGSLEYARWKHVSSIFHFVVNTLCPDALRDQPADWRILQLSGDLLLEKYNQSQAIPEFEAGLKINPRSAPLHVSLAQAALQDSEPEQARQHAENALRWNPACLPALVILAEIELASSDPAAARKWIDRARQVNPLDQSLLAREAACVLLEEGYPDLETLDRLLQNLGTAPPDDSSKFITLCHEVASRNPRPGEFLHELGAFCDGARKYRHAERLYRAAVDLMPQLSAPHTNLGMLYMRTGQIDEAQRLLDDAFKADPFHVRVSNMRKVLGVLSGYETISTEHFLIRVDPADRLLGEYMGEYLEQVYSELTEQFGYEPPQRTRFEIYNSAKGQTAHQWFSARMIGLPWIQTIGASTGMIVALASPAAVDRPFNWARVLKHEFVHIVTLQQTDFNIPHWYTEALAVRSEDMSLPDEWKSLLLKRVPTGQVFTLKTVNQGFQRPEGPDDWNMAYCQSRLYAEMIETEWGTPALAELVDAYCRGLSTEQAFHEVLNISPDEFDRRFRKSLNNLVADIERSRSQPEIDLDTAEAAYRRNSDSAEAAGRYAWALYSVRKRDEAEQLANQALQRDPRQPLAVAVLAELAIRSGNADDALARLREVWDEQNPHPVLLARLAEQELNAGHEARALELYQLGVREFPLETEFWKGLALAALRTGAHDQARLSLEEIARRDGEGTGIRRRLAQLAFDDGDYTAAARWAREILYIDIEDPAGHLLLARSLEKLGDTDRSRKEYERTLLFNPESVEAHVGLARLARSRRNSLDMNRHLNAALRLDPQNSEALRMKGAGDPADASPPPETDPQIQ